MVTYNIIDLETSVKNRGEERIGTFKASPYHPDNKIVMAGYLNPFWSPTGIIHERAVSPPIDIGSKCSNILLVGQNIGFDLLYLLLSDKSKDWLEWVKNGQIWDTMLAEYLLTGQQAKYASLDSMSVKYGGNVKDSRIKDYWNSDMDTEDIPKDELREYLEQDLLNTEIVFLAQLDKASELGMLDLIYTQMEARLATIMMEYHGMYIDRELLQEQAVELRMDKNMCVAELYDMLTKVIPVLTEEPEQALNSPKILSMYLFGGTYVYVTRDPMLDEEGNPILYKTGAKKGEPRTAKETHKYAVSQALDGSIISTKGKAGYYNTSEATLKSILKAYPGLTVGGFCDRLLTYRGIVKDLGTYYTGYGKLVWHDDKLHPSFNHCATDTGRLSCSNPNVQQASS